MTSVTQHHVLCFITFLSFVFFFLSWIIFSFFLFPADRNTYTSVVNFAVTLDGRTWTRMLLQYQYIGNSLFAFFLVANLVPKFTCHLFCFFPVLQFPVVVFFSSPSFVVRVTSTVYHFKICNGCNLRRVRYVAAPLFFAFFSCCST